MSNLENKRVDSPIGSVITPQQIREVLNINNAQIEELCRHASVRPKRDAKGLTYFSKDDFETLKGFSGLKARVMKPKAAIEKTQKETTAAMQRLNDSSFRQLVQSLKNIETAITDKVSAIMDEKLDGMDDVVVELIRCKTENETLRYKINELNKENYNLKNQLSSYKNVALNVYVKKG